MGDSGVAVLDVHQPAKNEAMDSDNNNSTTINTTNTGLTNNNNNNNNNNNPSNSNNNDNQLSKNNSSSTTTDNNAATGNGTDNNNTQTQNNSNNQNNNNKNNRGNSNSRRGRSRSPMNNQAKDPRSLRRVYVANVAFDVKWNELKDFFREKIGNVVYCQMFENDDGKSRGCGLVEFSDQQSAKRAIETLHRSEYKGRELVVKEDLDCERDRYGRIITPNSNRNRDDSQRRDGGGGSGGGGGGNRGNRQMQQQQQQDSYGYDHSVMSNAYGAQHQNTYGLSQQFLDSLGISGPLNNRIFVANLDYKVDSNKLEEIYKLAGKVAKVKLSTDSSGQSKGYGTIEYEHPVEAVQAISMFHNQKLYGRPMSVRMDKYECEDDAEALPTKLPSGLDSIGKGLGVGGQPLNIAKSIMNAALVAPPHLGGPGQPVSHVPQAVQPMQQVVMQPMSAVAGHGLGDSISTYPTLQHQTSMAAAAVGSVGPNTGNMSMSTNAGQPVNVYHHQQQAVSSIQNPAAGHMNPQAVLTGTMQNTVNTLSTMNNATAVGAPNANNLSVYSTFERAFREKYPIQVTNQQAATGQQQQNPQQQQQQQQQTNDNLMGVRSNQLPPTNYAWQQTTMRDSRFGDTRN